ncbi:hypothetical protein [Lysobacter sp. F60174L2]|uniref:hypothetical protein n=1 Tax=Lysobacter sp. F60174L2 TaxID=3459295 RepID=UPI00403E304E
MTQQAESRPARPGSLQLDEHLHFQHMLQVLRRIGTLVLSIILLAALAGLFGGNGPFARIQSDAGALEADHPRFARYQMPTRLAFVVDRAAVRGDTFELSIEGDYAREFSFEQIHPQPEEVVIADDRIRYTFNAGPGERQLVVIQGQPETMGWLAGAVSVPGQPPLRIDSFIYP